MHAQQLHKLDKISQKEINATRFICSRKQKSPAAGRLRLTLGFVHSLCMAHMSPISSACRYSCKSLEQLPPNWPTSSGHSSPMCSALNTLRTSPMCRSAVKLRCTGGNAGADDACCWCSSCRCSTNPSGLCWATAITSSAARYPINAVRCIFGPFVCVFAANVSEPNSCSYKL